LAALAIFVDSSRYCSGLPFVELEMAVVGLLADSSHPLLSLLTLGYLWADFYQESNEGHEIPACPTVAK